MKTKRIEVAGKTYTLTANRNIMKIIYDIAPELLKLDIDPENDMAKFKNALGTFGTLKIISELDVVFYNMIKVAHPEISKEKSDEILDNFDAEYEDVSDNILAFAFSVFTDGNPNIKKKKLNW